MKKKIIVLAAFIVVIGLVTYLYSSAEATDQKISKEWSISNDEIEELSMTGAKQDVEVVITRTEAAKTTVSLQGKVSSKTEKYMENNMETNENLLKITLSDIEGLSILPSSSDKDTLILNIQLGKNADINNLNIESIIGDVNIQVPESFQGEYITDVSNGGDVIEIPDTDNSQDNVLYVKTMGYITITK